MWESSTPYELFSFAAKLRTRLDAKGRKEKVDFLINILGLEDCKDTSVGGPMMVKGLSGGERKRASIGYELITDPHLCLLDEPTSGLDS